MFIDRSSGYLFGPTLRLAFVPLALFNVFVHSFVFICPGFLWHLIITSAFTNARDASSVADVSRAMQTHHTVNWLDSLDQAELAARDTQKLVLLDLFNPS